MIVKDEQENLPRCLASIAGIFDEIIVVDTGSTDRTREIAREFGAKVFDFVWVDSFAAGQRGTGVRPERPDDPFVLFNLGVSAIERRELPEVLGFLERSLAGSAPSDSIVCKLFALIARTHQMMGDSRAALATCGRGLELMPDDAELWFRKGIVHRHRGESSDAEQCWRLILTLTRPEQFRSVDPGIYGHLTRRNGGAGRRARRSCRGAAIVGGRAGRVPGRSRGTGEARAGVPAGDGGAGSARNRL